MQCTSNRCNCGNGGSSPTPAGEERSSCWNERSSFKSEDLKCPLQILQKLVKLTKLTHCITSTLDLEKPFRVVIQDCQTWRVQRI